MNLRSLSLKTIAAGLVLAVGVPAMAMAANPFEDVLDGQWYSEPVDWAYNEGITTGKTPTTFNGWDETNRYEVVTFVHRYEENIVRPRVAEVENQITEEIDDHVEDGYTMFGYDSNDAHIVTTGNVLADTGLSTSVTVPTGHTGVIVVDFAAESSCYDGDASGDYCSIAIFVDGSNITPLGFAFDSDDQGNETDESWEAHATRMISGELTPGTYEVTVMYGASDDGMSFRLDEMTLTAEVQLTGDHELGFADND